MRKLLAVGLLVLSLPAAALATVRDVPVQLRVVTPVVRTGNHVRVEIQARPLRPGTFEATDVQLERGAVRRVERPRVAPLATSATASVTFEADLDPASARGWIDYQFDGRPGRWGFDLSGLGEDGEWRPRTSPVLAEDGSVLVPPATREQLALPVRERPAPASPSATNLPGERDIHLHGKITYRRPATGTTPAADVPAEGVTVRFYDNDLNFLTYLTQTVSGPDGTFDLQYHWVPWNLTDPDPDIITDFALANDNFTLRNSWGLGVYKEMTGTRIDVGSDYLLPFRSREEDFLPVYDLLTNLNRTRRWLESEGFALPHVTVYTPEITGSLFGSGSWYNDVENAIHVGEDRNWDAPTHIHEYGHFFISRFGAHLAPDYCNGTCDGSAPWPTPWDCGHCAWCTETDHDAWNEGIASVLAEYLTVQWGLAAVWSFGSESIQLCGATGAEGDPLRTEGHLQAALRDLWDPILASERWTSAPQFSDQVQLPFSHILQVAAHDDPVTPAQFFARYKTRYPAEKQAMYWAQRLANYPATDATAPGQPGVISSGTHSFGFPSLDRTVACEWPAATDDESGVLTYRISFDTQPRSAGLGFANWDQDAGLRVGRYTFDSHGTYYANIAALDAEGNQGPTRSSGAIVIGPPDPADLEHMLRIGWGDRTVARAAADAALDNVPLPAAALPGFASSTYWNFGARNAGGSATADSATAALLLDGTPVRWFQWRPMAAGEPFGRINEGPVNVRGGRHAFVTQLDERNKLGEINETNNLYGRQFVWTPWTLAPNVNYLADAPPLANAWDGLTGWFWYNATGERMTAPAGNWWNLTWVAAQSHTTDYDCRIHFASPSADTGFGNNRGYSARPAGCLDAVLANRNTLGSASWDVGVVAPEGGTSYFNVKHVTETAFAWDDSVATTMPAGEYALVRELYVAAGNVGAVSVVVDHDPAQGTLYVGWFDRTFATGGLLDGIVGASDGAGRARVDINVVTAGYYGVVIWRDPKDGQSALPLTIEMGRTPPDLLPYTPGGWHSAFVPRPRLDGTALSVPLPDTLHGDSAATYLNLALRNESPGAGGAFQAEFDLDGVPTWWLGIGAFGGWATSGFNDGTGFTVRPGRHTLSARYDMPDQLEEIHEDNNGFGEQYVWGPKPAAMEVLFARYGPPDPQGGWLDLPAGAERRFNCDGWRTPRFATAGSDGYWGAAVVLPIGDVDMRLHEVADGAQAGFSTGFAFSGWGPYQTDFSIVNFNRTPLRAFDVGVLGTETGGFAYYAQAVKSRWLGSYPSGFKGPFTFDGGTLLELHEVYLPAGPAAITLASASGAIDWGLSVYGPTAATYSKSEALAAAWSSPAGIDEGLLAVAPSAGYYAVAVWRAGSGGSNDGTYRLNFRSGTTDVPGATPPAATRLAEPRPNPSGGATNLSFMLATAGEVSLAVYDVRGARVRSLVAGGREAGEHHATWDGRDENGGRVAPGIYLVRLDAGTVHGVRKMVRIE